jgi:hypothetical protein
MKNNCRIARVGVVAVALLSLFIGGIPCVRAERTASPKHEPAPIQGKSENATGPTQVTAGYGKLPLIFEQNLGQAAAPARFLAHRRRYDLFLAANEAVFNLGKNGSQPSTLRMKLAGANAQARIQGMDRLPGVSNYYRGNQPQRWLTQVPQFAAVGYRQIYNGVDLIFHDGGGALEYDFVVGPHGDPQAIKLEFAGAEKVMLDPEGNLLLRVGELELKQNAPVIYQDTLAGRKQIAGKFVIDADGQVGFSVDEYDRSSTLVIDPKISYLTYLGGEDGDEDEDAVDEAEGVVVDAAGNAIVTGTTDATDFPVPGTRSPRDARAVYVVKLDPTGRSLLFITYLDGEASDGLEIMYGNNGGKVAADPSGNIYVTGTTHSDRFPITENAYQKHRTICGAPPLYCFDYNDEVFVTKLNSAGEIAYSTYLGGRYRDVSNTIAVDREGKAYVAGYTTSGITFPTKNEFQTTGLFGLGLVDAYVTVFNPSGSDIVYCTVLGGNREEFLTGIALDAGNNAYITGETTSRDNFPTRNPFQATNGGGKDAFVAKLNPALVGDASLIYSTFSGGGGTDTGNAIAVTPNGDAYITGITGSRDYPLLNELDGINQVNEAFVTHLRSDGSLASSTFLGGSGEEQGNGIALDQSANVYVTGFTTSTDIPPALAFQAAKSVGKDAFVAKLRLEGSGFASPGVLSFSYLGGRGEDEGLSIAVQNGRVAYVCGRTPSTDLATTPGAFKGTAASISGFVARMLDTHKDSVGVFHPATTFQITQSTSAVLPVTINFGLGGQRGVAGDWDGDGTRTVGEFTNGVWRYRNITFASNQSIFLFTVTFGHVGDLPVVGHWNGDGIDTPGVFRPSTGQFLLTNSTATNPAVNLTITFGANGDLPVGGDWDGDGIDSVGVFRPSAATFFLTNQNVPAPGVDINAFFGIAEDLPIAGDWDADGKDSIGVWRPSALTFFLSNNNAAVDITATFGAAGDQPVVGDWDGKP